MSVVALSLACWVLLLIAALALLRMAGRSERAHEQAQRLRPLPTPRAEALRRARSAALMAAVVPLAAAALDATSSEARAAGPAACRGTAATTTLCLINAERRARGLAALRVNRRLADAARRHSLDMVARGYFAHQSLSGLTMGDRLKRVGYVARTCSWSAGETIAWGSGAQGTPAALVAAWMRSAAHRPILLGRAFREVGIGIARGTPTRMSAGATYTADFGRRRC